MLYIGGPTEEPIRSPQGGEQPQCDLEDERLVARDSFVSRPATWVDVKRTGHYASSPMPTHDTGVRIGREDSSKTGAVMDLRHITRTWATGPAALVPCVVATAVLVFLGTGLHPIWWLTWLAPLPMLLVAHRASARLARLSAILAWALGSLNMWPYYLGALHLPLLLVVGASLLPAAVFGLAVGLFRLLVLRDAPARAALSVPLVWVVYEFLYAELSPHATFGNLGYSQMECLPIVQLASLAGIWAIGFCLLLVPSTVAAVVARRGSARERGVVAAATCIAVAASIGFGFWRLSSAPSSAQTLRVGLVAAGAENEFFVGTLDGGADPLGLLHAYADKIPSLRGDGAELVVLPEKTAFIDAESLASADALLAREATDAGVPIVVGLDVGGDAQRENQERMYTPQGTVAATYTKHHLVPGFEDRDSPGTGITILEQPSGVWGMEICKDMDFPALSRQYGRLDVALLVVPAWDFGEDGWLHDRMAVLRGVESGFTVVRAAAEGRLTISDDRGRVLAEAVSEQAPFTTLVASAPLSHTPTLYAVWGDWFAFIAVAGLVALIASLVVRPNRAPPGPSLQAP